MASCLSLIQSVVGVDVAKDTVTFHDLPSGQTVTVANTRAALLAAFEPLGDRELVVSEATGGHEDTLLAVLVTLGLPAHRAAGARVHAFARSLHSAKTDRLDAAVLARYGAERGAGLARWAPLAYHRGTLAALTARRRTLVEARKAERTRAKAPREAFIRASVERAIAFLDGEIVAIEADIACILDTVPELAAQKAVLKTVPGFGDVVTANVLALMPELGTLTRRKAAALAGLAPHPKDSGITNARRRTTGGRRAMRPILFIAALTAVRGQSPIRDFYKRLLANAKSKRLALVAVMRKLIVIANARLAEINPKPQPQLT